MAFFSSAPVPTQNDSKYSWNVENVGLSSPVPPSASPPMSTRFTMLGRLQLQQPLDFSCTPNRSPPPPISILQQHLQAQSAAAPGCGGGVVDLSINSRPRSRASSTCSSEPAIASPPLLAALLQNEQPSIVTSQPLPQLATTIFKKSPSAMRPFKAYPKDPLSLPLGLAGCSVSPVETVLSAASNEAYQEFRRQMLAQVAAGKGRRYDGSSGACSSSSGSSDNAPPSSSQHPTQPEEAGSPQQPSSSACIGQDGASNSVGGAQRDPGYWERRRKNNEAAKRSRDARRAKEDEIAIRAAFLEQENLKLKYEVAALRSETSRLRCLLYSN